jgi:hypothetical protein
MSSYVNPALLYLQTSQRLSEFVEYAIFYGLCGFIGCVSALDAALVVQYQKTIREQNPVGKLLLDFHGPAGLVFVKMVGTISVLGVLLLLHARWRPAARVIVVALALFQAGLVVYLYS